MTTRIKCYTLFNITETGVPNRSNPPVNTDPVEWTHKRNTQCNYDTILQVISLRSQPEDLSTPKSLQITKDLHQYFGSDYKFNKNSRCWTFDFAVSHGSVFNNGITEIGALFSDSHGVPMILVGDEIRNCVSSLNTTSQHKNIHYVVISND